VSESRGGVTYAVDVDSDDNTNTAEDVAEPVGADEDVSGPTLLSSLPSSTVFILLYL